MSKNDHQLVDPLVWLDSCHGKSAVVWLCRLVALVKQENRSPVEAAGMGKAAKGGKKLPSAPLADKKKKAKKKLDMDQT